MRTPPPARDIHEVVRSLDAIVDDCRQRGCRLGLFAALYRRVTVEVKGRIDKDGFVDSERMERLDTTFANRYLDAYARHRRGESPTRSWAAAFEARDDDGLLVLQHLLLGMNAHILLDLGIATAEVAARHGTHGLQHDFDDINDVLADLVDAIQDRVGHSSPLLRTLDRIGGRLDEHVFGVGLARARGRAWRYARALQSTPGPLRPHLVGHIDRRVERVAHRIRRPPVHLLAALRPLRDAERDPIPVLIERLV